jgi:hypothetical protein
LWQQDFTLTALLTAPEELSTATLDFRKASMDASVRPVLGSELMPLITQQHFFGGALEKITKAMMRNQRNMVVESELEKLLDCRPS